MAKNNEAKVKRIAKKAQNLLERRGGKLRFVGGTALDSTTNMGMQELLKTVTTMKDREMLAEAISQCLHYVERDWTIIYGFIHERGEDDFVIDVDSMVINNANAEGMAIAANYTMAKEFSQEPVMTRIGQVWMAIPKVLPETFSEIEYITNIAQWMLDVDFFEAEHMRGRLAAIAAHDLLEAQKAVEELETTANVSEVVEQE